MLSYVYIICLCSRSAACAYYIIYIYTYTYILYMHTYIICTYTFAFSLPCGPSNIGKARDNPGRCCDVGHKTGRKLDHVVETILFIRCWPHHILYSDIPSGYLTWPWKITILMGTSSINGPFSMATLNNQRVYIYIYNCHYFLPHTQEGSN